MAIGARTPSKKGTQQMMIPSNYEMNIARELADTGQTPRRVHFCRIELGQLLPDQARTHAQMVAERFPPSEGWSVTFSKVTCYADQLPLGNY
jgi:hypothetical protein